MTVPALSVVITVAGGAASLRRCLGSLGPQTRGRAVEVIVPFDRTVGDLSAVRREFPDVVFLDQGEVSTRCQPGTAAAAHEIFDRRKSWGLVAARGEVVALLDDDGAPAPDWCEQMLAAHRELPHGVIGGVVEHTGRGALNWATFFQDFGRYQPPLAEGPAPSLTDVNVSYKRAALEGVRPLWQERYNEATVHWALARNGVTFWRRPQCVVRLDRGRRALGRVLWERFGWGRLFGSLRAREMSALKRLMFVAATPVLPLVLLARTAKKVFAVGRGRGRFLATLPAAWVTMTAWCLGESWGLVTGREEAAPAAKLAERGEVAHADRG